MWVVKCAFSNVSWKLGICYFILFAVMVCAFSYLLFPEERVKRIVERRFAGTTPSSVSLAIGEVSLRFPGSLAMHSVRVKRRNRTVAEISRLTLNPDFNVVLAKINKVSFRGEAFAGVFEGAFQQASSSGGRRLLVDVVFSGLKLQKIQVLQKSLDGRIAGTGKGRFRYREYPAEGTEERKQEIVLKDATMALDQELYGVQNIRLSPLKMLWKRNVSTLKITRCRFATRKLQGKVQGRIRMKEPISRSRLDISGVLQARRKLSVQGSNRGLPRELVQKLNVNKQARYHISGWLGSPIVH